MTMNGVMAVILRYFTGLNSFDVKVVEVIDPYYLQQNVAQYSNA